MICDSQEGIWTVEVDRSQIEQVLVNLYLNAWQAMGHRGAVHIKSENVVLDNNFVRPFEVLPGKYVRVSVPNVKVILSSGYSLTGVAKEILDKGSDEYIQKPFSLSQISRITRELLDNKNE